MSAVTDGTTLEQLGEEVRRLSTELRHLQDRQAILDCVTRYTRGVDRHDEEIILSAFHDDAVDEHGKLHTGMPDFARQVNSGHAAWTRQHTHNITSHLCEIDGDVAHAETYVVAALASADEPIVRLNGARYADRLERRDGEWKIALRKVIIDWIMVGDATYFHTPEYAERGFPEGKRDRTDIVYERPLRPTT